MNLKNIMAVTMGDPYGIGPEVIVKAIYEEKKHDDILIVGDYAVIKRAKDLFAPGIGFYPVKDIEDIDFASAGVPVIDLDKISLDDGLKGRGPTAEGGRISIHFIRYAVELTLKGRVAAVITGPISKEAIHMAGYPYAGHTEFLAELTKTERFAMMLVGGPLRVILVTTHCSLSSVPRIINKERIYNVLRLSHEWWKRFLGYSPRLAVAALNPHGSEGGIFGNEEELYIIPAIELAREEGIIVTGPYPADTLFYHARDGRYDAVVVMYHDQGLIPLKMISFGKGVNCTLGLPIIRTSVDHGTGFDIAWKGRADPSSLKEAIGMARNLVHRKWGLEDGKKANRNIV
ncbi:MAG: 4-hydroxythreonine-4-phosphate dehydrogenase PdxA [bacterium]